MRILPISNRVSYKGNPENLKCKKPQRVTEVTAESIMQEAQDRYVKEHQELYKKWDILIHKPQKYQKTGKNKNENSKVQR